MDYFTSSNSVYVMPEKFIYNYFQLTSSFDPDDINFSEFLSQMDLRTTQEKIDDMFSEFNILLPSIPLEDTRGNSYSSLNEIITQSALQIPFSYETKSVADDLRLQIQQNINYSSSYAALVDQELAMHSLYLQYIMSSVTQSNNYVNLTPQGQALQSIISGNYSNLLSKR